ncbi:MAG: hypothetical protein IKR59_09415 [Lachnospiraceae bacterium]|nr:hypothetical protein [Lachnospiraceae bacterium]
MTDKSTVNITISVTPAERKALKQAALDQDMSVSALIRLWLKHYQEENRQNSGNGGVRE